MVSKSNICLICKQDSNNLNSIDSSDVQIVFKQNVTIDVCNSCFGKFELILNFLKTLKKTKYNKKAVCSICFKSSLYLFNLNEKNKDKFAEKIQYCNVQASIQPLRNVCYQCLYLTDLWYDLKKQYEIVITGQVLSNPEAPRPILKIKLTIPKDYKQEVFETKSPNKKLKLSLPKDFNQEKSGMKSSNKKRKSDTNIEDGTRTGYQIENTKLQKLQKKLQLDICNADAYAKPTMLKRRRNSSGTTTNSIISINDSVENLTVNDLQPANTYFTNHRKKWLKPKIKADSKLLNTICKVDLSSSFIPEKVLKRLEERNFVRVKAIASDIENEQQSSPSVPSSPPVKQSKSSNKSKKFTAARKFAKVTPKSKRVIKSTLEEIRPSRSQIDTSLCKSPQSDRTDFDYGINRHSYDAFSTDKEKVVMVLLHNVDEFDKKSNKRKSDDITSVTSSSTEGDDDFIDEDEQRLGRFACLENYMAGLPRLILHRMDSNVNDLNAKVSKKIKKRISFKEASKDGTEEFITPEKNPSFDDIKKEIEQRVKAKMAHRNLDSPTNSSTAMKSSNNEGTQNPVEGSSIEVSDDDGLTSDEGIKLRVSPSEDDEKQTKEETNAVNAEKSPVTIANDTTEIDDDHNEIVCLDLEVVTSKQNGDVSNNIVDTGQNGDVSNNIVDKEQNGDVSNNIADTEKNGDVSNNIVDTEQNGDGSNNIVDTEQNGDASNNIVDTEQNDDVSNNIVDTEPNGDVSNNIVDTEQNDNADENSAQDQVQCNIEITTTGQPDSDQIENTANEVGEINNQAKEKEFCEVAQKLAELDA